MAVRKEAATGVGRGLAKGGAPAKAPARGGGRARLVRTFGAVNIGSFRISAMIMGETETGELVVLGSGHRMSAGVKRGYVTDPRAATHAIRDAVERAEQNAQTAINSVWVACSGAGLDSYSEPTEIDIGGRRIEEDAVERLLA